MKSLTFTNAEGTLDTGLLSPFVSGLSSGNWGLSKRLARNTANTKREAAQKGIRRRYRMLGAGGRDARRRKRWGRTLEFLTGGATIQKGRKG
jgi:hypothetical protein